MPVSLYDITGGQKHEENGFGYMRSVFITEKNRSLSNVKSEPKIEGL